jgi:cytochrome c553
MLMKRCRLLALLSGALLLALGVPLGAQTERPPLPPVIPGLDRLAGHLAELVPACVACHGENGVPNYAESPVIDGQHEGYLYIQLRDYKNGSRKHEVMGEIVKDLTRQDLRDLAAFFAKRAWPRLQQTAEEGDDVVAERLAGAGMCKECHLGGYLGDSTVPRLAGQLTTYLVVTMRALKTKERANNAAMSTLLDTYKDEEIDALARYLGSL